MWSIKNNSAWGGSAVAETFVLSLVLCSALTSCLQPFSAQVKTHVTDKTAPVITLSSPQDGSPYSSAIEVKGIVKDFADAAGDPGKVQSLKYEVLATSVTGSVPLAADGSFDFTFLASSLHGAVTVRLDAVDWNGNSSQASLSLVDSGNGIPGFQATAASGSVTLSWPSIPLADHYDLFYETSDIMPSEQFSKKVSPVSSGYLLSSLVNGNIHAFLLKSIPAAGSGAAINWSTVQKVMPLSKGQLVPTLDSGHDSIKITWAPVGAASAYEVWKGSSTVESGLVNVSGTVQGSSFTDFSVQAGQTYYYAVKPAQYTQTLSWTRAASPDPFPIDSRREIATTTTTGLLSAIVASADGHYLYVADQSDGIVVYGVSTPGSPIRLGSLPLISQAAYANLPIGQNTYSTIAPPFTALALGPYGYLIAISAVDDGNNNLYGRLSVIDVSSPSAPREVSGINTGAAVGTDFMPTGLAVAGSRVFMGEFSYNAVNGRLADADIAANGSFSNQNASTTITGNGSIVFPIETNGANTVYVGNYTGVQVYTANASTGALTLAGSVTTGASDWISSLRYFTVSASAYVYVGTLSGMRIVNVTTPASPALVGSLVATTTPVTDIRLSGGRAYLSTQNSGLAIYDISSPLAPALAAAYRVSPAAVGSATVGSTVFLALGSPATGFKVLDASLPRPAFQRSAAGLGGGVISGLAASDRYLYATDGLGIEVYDMNAASWPQAAGTMSTRPHDSAYAIAVSGNLLVTGSTTLSIYDIGANPLVPALLASLPVPYYLIGVEVRGSFAYAVCRDFGLKIFDISTPTAPKELGSLPLTTTAQSLALIGTTILVPHATTKLAVIDATDPLAPRLVTDFSLTKFNAGSVFVSNVKAEGTLAYVCETSGGLTILDLSTPSAPIELGNVAVPADGRGLQDLAIQGQYAYVVRNQAGLSIVDVADPKNPVLVSTLYAALSEALNYVRVRGNQVFAASPGGGFYGGILGYQTN